MNGFLGVGAGHNGEVNRPAQVDQVGIGLILDLHGLGLFILLFLGRTVVLVIVIILVIASFAQDLGLELLVRLFVLLPF